MLGSLPVPAAADAAASGRPPLEPIYKLLVKAPLTVHFIGCYTATLRDFQRLESAYRESPDGLMPQMQ